MGYMHVFCILIQNVMFITSNNSILVLKIYLHTLEVMPYNMKHYCAKPSVQLPKYMYILHCCYKLADNHPTLFQLHIY